MSSTSASRCVPPSVSLLLSALADAGVDGFHDEEEGVIFAHPTNVPQEQALDHTHVMIAWTPDDSAQPGSDLGHIDATLWQPDGPPDHHLLGSLYTTSGRQPLATEAERTARAVADWSAGRIAGLVLLAALAEYGITPDDGLNIHPEGFDVPVQFTRGISGHLSVADRACSVRHVPTVHTGWSMFLHDERGEPIGDPVYIAGDGGTVDCTEDSATLAATVADWLTSPVSRHCDCYHHENPGRPHDTECNRYRRPPESGTTRAHAELRETHTTAPGFQVAIDADSVYLRDDAGEIAMWTQDEWTADPPLVLAIAHAINLGHTQGPTAIRNRLRNTAPATD
ncbi:hypothetical protein [Streptomyces sp. NBC_00470]|uniref:hypothetical protein n=1 Tax=Streptomyces sp. NBC_00470 TaxID=2975753 RepID=UPI002F91403C